MLWIYESLTFPFYRAGPVIDCPCSHRCGKLRGAHTCAPCKPAGDNR